jgi:hypothetical protein
MTLMIKTIPSVLKVLTYIVTNFTARDRLVAVLVIMSISTFTTVVMLYITLNAGFFNIEKISIGYILIVICIVIIPYDEYQLTT